MTNTLVEHLNSDFEQYKNFQLDSRDTGDLIPKWRELVDSQLKRFVAYDGYLDFNLLKDFRRKQIFVPDLPERELNQFNVRNFIGGQRRGAYLMLKECLDVFKVYGDENLLSKYPCSNAGNPYIFRRQGYSYTFRWIKHIYSLGLVNRFLGDKLCSDFISLDIGSSYGIFPSLLNQEYPGSHHVLVDFPEQLLLAHYYLGTTLPEARIAGIDDVCMQVSINRDYVKNYDFVLVPITLFEKLVGLEPNLVSNFASFGEMSRKWFEFYVNSAPVRSAEFLFTTNRIDSSPTYDTDLTILDYPIWDESKVLHFAVSPIFSYTYMYLRRLLFWNEKVQYPPHFEYIGRVAG